MKVDYEEVTRYYEVFRHGCPGDGEYEDAVDSLLWAIPDILKDVEILENKIAGLEARLRYMTEERDMLEWELTDVKRGDSE